MGAYEEDHDSVGGNYLYKTGSDYIFYKDQGGPDNWRQVKKITAVDRSEGGEFGYSVSISGDYAIVGAYQEAEDALGDNTIENA